MTTLGLTSARIVRQTLPIPELDRPRRVAHLTDLHVGWATPDGLIRDALQLARATDPELVVLTGDFVCRGPRFLPRLVRWLTAVDRPCVAVLGNHDHFVGGERVRRGLERAGVIVLQNAWTEVDGLPIAGMDDGVTGHADPRATVRGLPRDRGVLGLTHDPADAPALWEGDVRTVLSGHTHGGQVHLGRLTRRLHQRLHPYLSGATHTARGSVYVNAGVGSSLLPVRRGVGTAREVAMLTLVPG